MISESVPCVFQRHKMRGLVHFTAVLWLVMRGPVASAQSVEIEGGSAMLNDDHVMRCNLVDFSGSTSTLEYEWQVFGGEVVMPRDTSNVFLLPSVAVTDALTYECHVYASEGAEAPLATGTSALNITIPTFPMRVTRDISSISRVNYVGLNISYGCEILFPLALTSDLTADVEIFGPDDTLIEGSDGRVRVGPLMQSGTGGDFERNLYFDPISAADRGIYRCTGTVRPVVENSLVTNGRGEEPEEISVFDPSLAVEISGVIAERYLDIAPYNTIALTCTAMLTFFRMPVPGSMRFSWLRAVGGSSPAPLPAQTFTDDNIVGSTGVSMLNVSAEEAGSHTYSCVVSLDVSPATDNITETGTISLEVTGPTSPSPPVDLMAVEETLSSDSATIQWRVVAIQYAPEVYTVVYGTTESSLTSTSDQVSSGEDTTRTNFELSMELTGLQDNTTYYYQVVVNNAEGVAESSISSFTTTDLRITTGSSTIIITDSSTVITTGSSTVIIADPSTIIIMAVSAMVVLLVVRD